MSYVREDAALVDRLAADLARLGIEVWLDRHKLHPGERWRDAIRAAINHGAFFVACFSRSYSSRRRSYMNEEMTIAIEELRLRPTDRGWFVPLSLDGTTVPKRNIGAGETLHDLQWVDLSTNWEGGVRQIAQLCADGPEPLNSQATGNRLPIASVIPPNADVLPGLRAIYAQAELEIQRAREQAERKSFNAFIDSGDGDRAAEEERQRLYNVIAARAADGSTGLSVEFEANATSCVIRSGPWAVAIISIQNAHYPFVRSRIAVMLYQGLYVVGQRNFFATERQRSIYHFAVRNGELGWETESREFLSSVDLAQFCTSVLLSAIRQDRVS